MVVAPGYVKIRYAMYRVPLNNVLSTYVLVSKRSSRAGDYRTAPRIIYRYGTVVLLAPLRLRHGSEVKEQLYTDGSWCLSSCLLEGSPVPSFASICLNQVSHYLLEAK